MAPQRTKSPKARASSTSAAADTDEHHPPPHGCLHGLFHLLDVNQRLHLRKMLPYRRHIYGTKSRKVKQIASLSCEGKESVDTDGNILMEDRAGTTNESSGKALSSSQNSEGSTDLENKRSNSLRASRLLRTISIHHHLEGNGYVESMDPRAENPTDELKPQDDRDREHIPLSSKSSDEPTFHKACGEPCGSLTATDNGRSQPQLDGLPSHLQEKQSLLEESSNEARGTLSKQNGEDAKGMEIGGAPFQQSKEFLDVMVLLNSNRELFLKLLNDPSVIASYLQSQQISTPDRVSGRLRSFTVMGSPSRKFDGNKPPKTTESAIDRSRDFQTGTSSSSPDTNEKSIAGDRLGPSFLEGQRRSQKDDGTSAPDRFKVIKKRIKDVIKDDRKEGVRISMDGVIDKIPYGTKVSKDGKKANSQGRLERPASARFDTEKRKSLKRCHSLHESMDKYCRLFQSISSRDLKRVPDSSKSNREATVASQRPKPFARILSLPSFESYSSPRTNVKFRAPDAANPPKLYEPANLYNFGETESVDYTSVSTEENAEADGSVQVPTESDATKTVYEDEEHPVLRNQKDTCDMFDVSKGLTAAYKEAAKDEVELSEQPTTAQTSISESEDPELEARHIHYEEMAPFTNQQSQSDIDASYGQEGSVAGSDRSQMLADLDDRLLHVQVDEKDEAEFNYVRDILWRSGFGGEGSPGTWCSPDRPVDPLLYEETEQARGSSLDRQLLSDLTNEVLLDVYDASFAFCPWVSCFDPRVRPMPVDHHVLEEVWANVRWYLRYQPNLDLDHVVARDFAKNDGWMELQYDCEYVGLELEELILDELLDELVLQLGTR